MRLDPTHREYQPKTFTILTEERRPLKGILELLGEIVRKGSGATCEV